MNFILFTNQGYPLQNSSLGQLHSDRGIVSIVRSSAGRLLLIYLSARRLRSSGYYPKYQNGALSSGFWAGGIKRIHRDWDPAKRGAEEPQECFFLPKTHWWRLPCDMGRCHGAASKCVQCLVAHVPPFPESFEDFPIKRLIDSLFWWHIFLVDDLLTVKKTNDHRFVFGFAHSRFLGTGRVCSVPLPTMKFCLRVVLQNPWFITCDNVTENSGSLSRWSRRSRHTSLQLAFCSVVRFSGTILAHTFPMSKSCVKIWWTVNLTHYWSFSTSIDDLTSLFPHCLPFLRVKIFSHKVRLPLVLGLLKRTCAIWTLVPWIGMFSISPL